MSQLDDLMTIEECARRVHIDRATLKKFVLSHGLAIQWPGSKRLKVKQSEVEAEILRQRYLPGKAQKKATKPRSYAEPLHPLVRC